MSLQESPSLSPIDQYCLDRSSIFESEGIGVRDWDKLTRSDQYERLKELIGHTYLEEAGRFNNNAVVMKRELDNPSGSHYDRAFYATLREFEETGFIRPGDELRDITSGSGGISLAMLSKSLGYKVRITVPDELPEARLQPMYWFGAEIVKAGPGYMTRASEFQAGEIAVLKADPAWELSRPADRQQRAFLFTHRESGERICYLNHSENLLTPRAFGMIGQEAVAGLSTPPAAVALAIGNWTSIAGISPVIRAAWPDTRIIGYEGENTDVHDNFGTTVDGLRFRFKDESLIDEKVVVSNAERDRIDAEYNSRMPNVYWEIGHSSLMGLAVAETVARQTSGNVLTIAYDHKLRY